MRECVYSTEEKLYFDISTEKTATLNGTAGNFDSI